jgi:hypothetical protein
MVYTIRWPGIRPTAAIGIATQFCKRLTFLDVETAHCIFLGAADSLFSLIIFAKCRFESLPYIVQEGL